MAWTTTIKVSKSVYQQKDWSFAVHRIREFLCQPVALEENISGITGVLERDFRASRVVEESSYFLFGEWIA